MPQEVTKRVSKRTGRVSWQARVRIGNKPDGSPREIVKTFKLQKDARAWVVEKQGELAKGKLVQETKMTLAQLLDRWLDNAAKQRVRPQTLESYRTVLARYVTPNMGEVRLPQLKPLLIQSYLRELSERVFTRKRLVKDPNRKRRKKGDPPREKQYETVEYRLSPRTIRYAASILSAALRQAVRWQIIPSNAMDAVEMPRQRRTEMKALGRDEAMRFLEAASGSKHEALFVLAVVTGMRPSEYLALKWSDVQLGKGMVTIQRTLVPGKEGWHFGEPKTDKSRRTVPIPPSVVAILRQHKARQAEQRLHVGGAWQDHGLVFTNEIGEPIDRMNLLNRHLRPLLRKAGLPGSFRLYDLRHTAATLLLGAGIHPKITSERLGHASITLTLNTYSHVLPDMQREASDKMEELLFSQNSAVIT